MIFITGDTHGEQRRFSELAMPGESTWTSEDVVIVCGDFGYIWAEPSSYYQWMYYERILDDLEHRPYTIVFVDGNHENFHLLLNYPEEERFGNTVHVIRKNIFHLQRGRIYTIQGKTFFAFGGAQSTDQAMRTESVSWWPQELPSDEEYERGRESLRAADNTVDYIITHTMPNKLLYYPMFKRYRIGHTETLAEHRQTDFFNELWDTVTFRHWYFGHWHEDGEVVKDRATVLWFQVVALTDEK